MSERSRRIQIELKAINTPKGEVPTVESFQNLVDGLNILDGELEELREQYLKLIQEIKQDFKSMKKLIMDNTIGIEVVNERLEQLSKKLSEQAASEQQSIKDFTENTSKTLNDLLKAERNLEESFVKSMESISKILGLKLTARKEDHSKSL
ncbi:MAG: hypothetical protein OdinLCB4_005850 [Candidatus Odinarchaeum yellowstonii]|uniref:Uncharacterized protein n=1 Tax=Odinarchaeota yellowstonii (strain LCB_4) TaxID=1841599 RepID=A0AAF0D1N1_ODILC|nr:MAG: hypothetical protein OdinLCB4_005850 [Candidatus Odinarchaeum yellowstonii]